MKTSKTIAGIYGPMLVVMTITEMLNPRTWDTTIAPVTYLSGTLWFLAGVAILRFHNRWVRAWPVVVTVMGWFAVVLGTMRMVAPIGAQQGEAQSGAVVLVIQLVLIPIGAFLTYMAYRPSARDRVIELVTGASEGWAP
jgi:predicted permease